jgi:hypothetical protein
VSDQRHPDIDWKVATFGVANTSLGRAGFARHRTAQVTDHAFDDPEGWKMHEGAFTPVRHVVDAAHSYMNEKGLRDPSPKDYSRVMQSKDRVKALADHYDKAPDYDKSAEPHLDAMRDEVHQQHEFATKRMGIKFESVDHDPYPDVHSMVHDVNTNKRLQVLSTKATGGHPYLANHDNDKFRFVHDLFGHAATGRNFDRHGEEAAWQHHSQMFSDHARPAMSFELRGQNGSLIKNGDFAPQKVGTLPRHLWQDADWAPRHAYRLNGLTPPDTRAMPPRQAMLVDLAWRKPAMVKFAHDSGDGETIFHCPFCGSGQVLAASDGTVDCDFCQTSFTVQVQPQMPAFPQTVNGMPIDVPGMPAGGENASVPPDSPLAQQNATPDDGGGFPPGDESESQPPEEGDPGSDDTASGGPPDFLKNSYRTTRGATVTRVDMMRHLAITHALDRRAMTARVRAERQRR